MCGKLSVVYASGAANLLDAEILWTTEDRQEAISQGQVPGGLMYAYDMDGARGSGHARGCLPHSPGDDRGGKRSRLPMAMRTPTVGDTMESNTSDSDPSAWQHKRQEIRAESARLRQKSKQILEHVDTLLKRSYALLKRSSICEQRRTALS